MTVVLAVEAGFAKIPMAFPLHGAVEVTSINDNKIKIRIYIYLYNNNWLRKKVHKLLFFWNLYNS